jgi:hypothetical protein
MYVANCEYSLMVKFLLAKENMRVRFPLPAFLFKYFIYDYYDLLINHLLIKTQRKKQSKVFIFFYHF